MTTATIPHWDDLCAYTAEQAKRRAVPGVALGLLYEGQAAAAGFGVTSADNPLPVTEETLFQIGSISKTFCTTALLRLVERGALDLDAPVRRYLPAFRVADEAASAAVTVRHLLTHTGGWEGDFFEDGGDGDDALERYVALMAELPQLAPPGALFSYNNAGFYVAGRLVELAAGQEYRAALRELLLHPLGLQRCYLDPRDALTQRFAAGHRGGEEGPVVLRPWHLGRAVGPAGGIICDAPTLLAYARFHLGDGCAAGGERLLSEASLALMHAPQFPVWGREGRALGWAVDDRYALRRVSHGGGTYGHISLLSLVPERGLALAVLTNSMDGGAVTRDVERWVWRRYLGIEIADPRPLGASPEALAPYVGRYARPCSDSELGLLLGRLVGYTLARWGFPTRDTPLPPPPPPSLLDLCEPDRLVVTDGPGKGSVIDIVRRADGSIGWLRMGSRLYVRR